MLTEINLFMKYLFFLPNTDFYRYAYRDLQNCNNCVVFYDLADNRNVFVRRYHDFIRYTKISKYIPALGALVFDENINKSDCLEEFCFVFSARLIEASYCYNYILYLKSKYPNAKFVCYYQDIIKSFKGYLHPNNVKNIFDLVVSYNRQDALNFNICYYPTSYSVNPQDICKTKIDNDVYFLGKAKDRGELILNLAKQLNSINMRCDFNILDMPDILKEKIPGVKYISKPLSYSDNIEHLKRSLAVLEIMQGGADGYTFRTWESIAFNKVLLTNNNYILNDREFYDDQYTILIQNKITGNDVENIRTKERPPHRCGDRITPIRFIEFLNKKIK